MPSQNLLRYRRPPIGKPPLGARVDWLHPMSKGLAHCYLLNEGGGDVHDLAAGAYPNVPYPVGAFRGLSATHRWSSGPFGTNILFDQVDGADINFTEGGIAVGTGNISVFVICRDVGNVATEALGSTTGTGNDAYHWSAAAGGGGTVVWVLTNIAGIDSGISVATGPPLGIGFAYTRTVQCFFSVTNLSTGITSTATVAGASTPGVQTSQPATLGSKWGAAASTWNGQIYLTYIWRDRLLTAAEFVALNAEPYQFLYSPAQTYRAFQQPIITVTTLPIFVQC